MGAQLTVQKIFSLGGLGFQQNSPVQGDMAIVREESIAAAKAGTLTTRTDDDTGAITLAAGQGANFVATNRVNVFWTVGGVQGYRRNMLVSSVAGDIVTVGTAGGDVGAGDVLPAQASSVFLAKQVQMKLPLVGDDVIGLVFFTTYRGVFTLTGDDDVEDYFRVMQANAADAWYLGDGDPNPIAGDIITRCYVAHESTTAALMRIGALLT